MRLFRWTPVSQPTSQVQPGLPAPEQKPELEALDFLSLLPGPGLNQASFSNHLASLESQSSGPIALNQRTAQTQQLHRTLP